MVNEIALAEAIADLKSQSNRNFRTTAEKHHVDRKTLQRRFEGTTASNRTAHLEAQGHLTPAQEKILIDRINELSIRGIPPTPQFVENLVAEFINEYVGEHWVNCFVKRHDDQLETIFLDSIDYARRVADNSRHFQHYFMLVGI